MTTFITKKRLKTFTLILVLLGISSVFVANIIIGNSNNDRLYSSTDSIPYNRVGLLLGTGKFIRNKYINPYYQNRIVAAAQLMRSNKISYLVISGDNSRQSYNEPMMMKSDLAKLGIDTTKIYLDYAGFRTFDSIVRLKEIFGQDSVTVISQPSHNLRAIFIANRKGIYAVGYNAQDIPENIGFKTNLREKLARVKVFIDLILDTKPKFLGQKISIP